MDKRVVVFLILSLGIILGFDIFLKQMGWFPEPPPAEDATATGPSPVEPKPAPTRVEGQNSGPPPVSAPTQSGQKSSTPSPSASPSVLEQTVTLETDLVRVGLSNRGGVIQSMELKRYHTSPPEVKPVQLV